MSKIADDVYAALLIEFPHNVIQKEHFIYYKGTRLFFDFLIKDLGVLIEVQGKQHTAFIKHFHSNKDNFLNQKKRDRLKVEYVMEGSKFCLARFNYDDEITPNLIKHKIYNALIHKFYE